MRTSVGESIRSFCVVIHSEVCTTSVAEKRIRMISRHAEKTCERAIETPSVILSFPNSVEVIYIVDGMYNDCIGCLDFGRFTELRELIIGNDCFRYVNKVKLDGLKKLERVVIGRNCFSECYGIDSNRHFCLKNCEQLRELRIDCQSFADFSVCEMENLDSLKVIEMGALNEESPNFCFASLQLMSEFTLF